MTAYYFVRPTDSLFVRGNLAFGDAGEHGVGVMPPPPSLFAGAFRSAILGRNANALSAFAQQGETGSAELDRALGTLNPETGAVRKQGTFRLTWLSLAGRNSGVEAIFPLPLDLVLLESGLTKLIPRAVHELMTAGRNLPLTAVLRTAKQEKPLGGFYLRQPGWVKHLAGSGLDVETDAIKADQLHIRDPRLGIGLNADSRTAETGLIYTTEGYAFIPKDSSFDETGFLVGIEGADNLLPESGFLRLGGDGRGAQYRRIEFQMREPSLKEAIRKDGRLRLILTTPGFFQDGWLPARVVRGDGEYRLHGGGFTARLACAAVPRREVISGWDLFQWKPKDAHRVVPVGSVYWFDDFQGDVNKLAEWVNGGLWADDADSQRKAEGFNNAHLAAWPRSE